MKNYILKFLLWVAKTFEDSKGNPSSRRITGFWVTGLLSVVVLVFLYIMFMLSKGSWPMQEKTIDVLEVVFKLTIALCCFILILFGIVTSEQVISFVKGRNETTTVTQTTKIDTTKPEEPIEPKE